ncbi:hypothetical protein JMJ56_20955 [Belnapia sp. T18]|uniref:Lipoprotein n=1 Tax=Belnapia arida TaxID=2804533 RepID=A0ABS1U746_9PROT|nr:hypothetical protein [Belnapia arida]MBL6080489.1 hypothetical protein [Belnapia arida]
MRLASLLLLGLLAACGTTQSPMAYAPTVPVSAVPARPLVMVSQPVTNQRRAGSDDPRWIGTIRGGYGNPVKTLEADQPVDQVVAAAFSEALAARGLQAGTGAGRYALAITIFQFDANQYARREATADFGIRVTERATGRELWSDRTKAYNVDGSILSLSTGVFASVEDLRRVALRSMSQAVDTLLDKPGFRAAIRG